jgi:hypothetical protein
MGVPVFMINVLPLQSLSPYLFNHQPTCSVPPGPAFLLGGLSVVGVVFVLVIPIHWAPWLLFDLHYHHGMAVRLPVRGVGSSL